MVKEFLTVQRYGRKSVETLATKCESGCDEKTSRNWGGKTHLL